MVRPEPFVREAGSGRSILCLHANASTSAQWRGLMELLAPRFHVFAVDSYDSGDQDAAAERFIDYWMGAGAWERTPEQRKAPIAASVVNVRRWGHALMTEPTPLEAFRTLDVPVLFMTGKRSTSSAHGVARLLVDALPQVEVVELDELGHMGPVTHPDQVNPVVEQFLERT
jgi:pimeloyl-ACP methyl ester carboxylesterase